MPALNHRRSSVTPVPRRIILWSIAAIAGLALAAAMTWATSRLTSQRIGLASSPSVGGLAPSVTARSVHSQTTTVTSTVTTTTTVTRTKHAHITPPPVTTTTATSPTAAPPPVTTAPVTHTETTPAVTTTTRTTTAARTTRPRRDRSDDGATGRSGTHQRDD